MSWQNLAIPDGEIKLFPNFISAPEATLLFNALNQEIAWEQPTIKVFGKEHLVPRKTAFYGLGNYSYSYSGITHLAKPFTFELQQIHAKLVAVTNPHTFNVVLLNYYKNGLDKMGWHADDEPELGLNPVIASINLGATRMFQLKHKSKPLPTVKIVLPHGSLLLMQGATQHHWKHQIPTQKGITEPRINLTFRKIIA